MGGLVCEHVVTRSVRDSAAILDATAGPVPGRSVLGAAAGAGPPSPPRPRSAPPRLRIAVMTESPSGSKVDPACVAAVGEAANLCESLGHQVEAATLDVDGDAFTTHFINQWACGQRLGHRRLGGAARPGRDRARRGAAELGAHRAGPLDQRGPVPDVGPGAAEDLAARSPSTSRASTSCSPRRWGSRRRRSARSTRRPASRWPACSGRPTTCRSPRRSTSRASRRSRCRCTGTSGPAGALPIGVQFVGRFGDEETLLSLAGQLEEAAPWAGRRPPVSALGRDQGRPGPTRTGRSPGRSVCPSRSSACTCCSGCRATTWRCRPACGWAGRARGAGRGPWRRTRSPRASAASTVASSVMPPSRMIGVVSAARNWRAKGRKKASS